MYAHVKHIPCGGMGHSLLAKIVGSGSSGYIQCPIYVIKNAGMLENADYYMVKLFPPFCGTWEFLSKPGPSITGTYLGHTGILIRSPVNGIAQLAVIDPRPAIPTHIERGKD